MELHSGLTLLGYVDVSPTCTLCFTTVQKLWPWYEWFVRRASPHGPSITHRAVCPLSAEWRGVCVWCGPSQPCAFIHFRSVTPLPFPVFKTDPKYWPDDCFSTQCAWKLHSRVWVQLECKDGAHTKRNCHCIRNGMYPYSGNVHWHRTIICNVSPHVFYIYDSVGLVVHMGVM